MSEPTPISQLIREVAAELAPEVLRELIGWKFCNFCGGLCTWGTAEFSTNVNSLVCPHCQHLIIEWPPGAPIFCDCGRDISNEYRVHDGLPVSWCCGVLIQAPTEFIEETNPKPLWIAPSCPGVEGAEPPQAAAPH